MLFVLSANYLIETYTILLSLANNVLFTSFVVDISSSLETLLIRDYLAFAGFIIIFVV